MSPENKHISGLNSSIISGPGSSKCPFLYWFPCPAVMNESTYWPILGYFKIFTILTIGKQHLVWLWFTFLSIWVSWNIFLMVKGHLYINFLLSCLFMVFSPCFHKAFSNLVLMLPFLYLLSIFTFRRRQWHPTPVLLPGKSHGRRSLVGCSPWGL